jgi:hypothetical protein
LREVPVVKPPLILAVGFYQEFYLRAIFRSLIEAQKIKVNKHFSEDAVAAAAWTVLLRYPDAYVAVVLETCSQDPEKIREVYEDCCRRIRSNISYEEERWHVAVAVPDLKTWALTDDFVRQEYEKIHQDPATASTPEDREKIEVTNYNTLGSKLLEWTVDHPFDLEGLKRQSRQVRELCTFIDESWNPKPKPVLATAADWF